MHTNTTYLILFKRRNICAYMYEFRKFKTFNNLTMQVLQFQKFMLAKFSFHYKIYIYKFDTMYVLIFIIFGIMYSLFVINTIKKGEASKLLLTVVINKKGKKESCLCCLSTRGKLNDISDSFFS